jgi:hypothetical protein
MTFSSAIFLPSKVANPFSSFHWCLKLPGLFSFSTRKGHGHAIFLPHPSPSMLWGGGSMMPFNLSIPSLTQVPCFTHTSSFLHISSLSLSLSLSPSPSQRERGSQWAINYKGCQLYWWPCNFSIQLLPDELECFTHGMHPSMVKTY